MSDLSNLDKDAVTEFFIDDAGNVWTCIGWISDPAAIMERFGTNERRTVVAQSRMGDSYAHERLNKDFKEWLALRHRGEGTLEPPPVEGDTDVRG